VTLKNSQLIEKQVGAGVSAVDSSVTAASTGAAVPESLEMPPMTVSIIGAVAGAVAASITVAPLLRLCRTGSP
jgi:hypothetical protein